MGREAWGRFGGACLLLGGLLALLASPARAQDVARLGTIERYEAPPSCPTQAAIDARVSTLAPAASTASVRARVAISVAGAELVAVVEIVSEGSNALRTLRGRRCEALVEAVALVIAMVIDPSAVSRVGAPASSESPPPVSVIEPETSETPAPVEIVPEPTPDETPATEPAPLVSTFTLSADELDRIPVRDVEDSPRPEPAPASAPLDVAFIAAAWLAGAAGPLPSPSYGAALLVGARVAGFEILLGGHVLAESRTQVAGTTRGGDFGLAAGRLRLGYAFDLAPVELVPLVAIDVGATWGRGFGVTRPSSGTALSVDVAVGLEARYFFLPELGITLFAELTIPVLRPNFVLTGVATSSVFRASEVGTLFGLGLVLRIR